MSDLKRRYSQSCWVLELEPQPSLPLKWLDQNIVRHATFKLFLVRADHGKEPLNLLSGDLPCLENLYRAVHTYLQPSQSEAEASAVQNSVKLVDLQRHHPESALAQGQTVQTEEGGDVGVLNKLKQLPRMDDSSDCSLLQSFQPQPFSITATKAAGHCLSYIDGTGEQSSQSPAGENLPQRTSIDAIHGVVLNSPAVTSLNSVSFIKVLLSSEQLQSLWVLLAEWEESKTGGNAPALPGALEWFKVLLPKAWQSDDFALPTWQRLIISLAIATVAIGGGGYVILRSWTDAPETIPSDADIGNLDNTGSILSFPSGSSTSSNPSGNGAVNPQQSAGAETALVPIQPGIGQPINTSGQSQTPAQPSEKLSVSSSSNRASSNPVTPAGIAPAAPSAGSTTNPSPPDIPSISEGINPGVKQSVIAQAPRAGEISPEDIPLLEPGAVSTTAQDLVSAPNLAGGLPPEDQASGNSPTAAESQPSGEPSDIAQAPAPTESQPLKNSGFPRLESYVSDNWKPNPTVSKALQYRLTIASDGKLKAIEPLSSEAKASLPELSFLEIGAQVDNHQGPNSLLIDITLMPNGKVLLRPTDTNPSPSEDN